MADLPLLNKTAIVTGASRGIGRGIAWALARQGATVVLGYTSESSRAGIAALQQEIASLPHAPPTYAVRADLGTLTGPSEFVADLAAQVGTSGGSAALHVDILVNNAGRECVQSLAALTADDYEAVYNLNVRAPILLTQAVLPRLRPAGRIINISSVGARAGFRQLSLYCSSKAALEALTRCWAAELGSNGTTVNAVSPGPVQSDMLNNIPPDLVAMQRAQTPVQNRLGTIDEVASIVAWLAGPTSRWVTGQVISASGGWAMY